MRAEGGRGAEGKGGVEGGGGEDEGGWVGTVRWNVDSATLLVALIAIDTGGRQCSYDPKALKWHCARYAGGLHSVAFCLSRLFSTTRRASLSSFNKWCLL